MSQSWARSVRARLAPSASVGRSDLKSCPDKRSLWLGPLQAPWVEHTQRLIEEGIPITGHQHDMVADKLPHAAPPVLTEWEVYCRRQVGRPSSASLARITWARCGNERPSTRLDSPDSCT